MNHQRRACCFPPWSKREGTGLEQVPRASSVPGLRGQGRPSGWMSPALGGTGVHALVTWWLRALGLGSRCRWEPAPGLLSPRGPLGTARAEGGVQREGSQHMAAALPACSQPADRRSSPCRNFFARSANLCAAGWVLCLFSFFFFSTPPASPTKTLILPSRPGDLHRKLTLRTAKERPAEEARPECGVWLFVCPLSRRCTKRGPGHPPDPRHPKCPLGGADARILPSVRDFGMLPCTTQGTAPSFVLGRGEFGRESPAVCQQPPEAECWGGSSHEGLPSSRSDGF